MTIFMIAGTMKVCFFRSWAELSMWIRYTSLGESGSTNETRDSGI